MNYFCPYCDTEKPEEDFPPQEEMEIPGICKECNDILQSAAELVI